MYSVKINLDNWTDFPNPALKLKKQNKKSNMMTNRNLIDLFILLLAQYQMSVRPGDVSLHCGGGNCRGGLGRRGGAGGGGIIEVHQRQTALAPRSPNRIGNVAVTRGVGAVAALLVQGALAILMIGAALDLHVSTGDAAFEYAPVETVSGCTR